MEIWKKHIVQGNLNFQQGRDEEAIKHYQLAVDRAKMLFKHWFTPEESVAALLTSFHNLGDTYLRNGKEMLGLDCYHEVHNILEDASDTEDNQEREDALLKGLRCSATQLMLLKKKLNKKNIDFSFKNESDASRITQES